MSDRKKSNAFLQNKALESSNIIGIVALKKTLERDFFADATIEVLHEGDHKFELIIHLNCNFGLTESLFHLNNGNWGNFKSCVLNGIKTSPFQSVLYQLAYDNNAEIDIKELSIHLRDTSIIVTKLPNYLIQDNLEEILNAVSGNFVHFTKGLSQMPYEIFVPIYEDIGDGLCKTKIKNNAHPGYLEFWGLYFDGQEESNVYDVKKKVIIEESNLFLLNYWE